MPTPTSDAVVPFDEAALARLANQFFRSLGTTDLSVGDAGGALPAGVPASQAAAPAVPDRPVSAPPQDLTAAPVPAGGAGGAPPPAAENPLGVPYAYAPALPTVDLPGLPASPPSTPYYFLAESVPYANAATVPEAAPSAPLHGQRDPRPATASNVAPRSATDPSALQRPPVADSFALPGTLELASLLRALSPEAEQAPASTAAPADRRFYFLDTVPAALPTAHPAFDVQAVRRDFPILSERVNGRQLVWLDNAATTQKPQAVIDRLAWFYAHENSNVHRAAHELAARSTDAYEGARSKVARFLGAASSEEIVFVRGTTEAINLVAQSWGRQNVGAGDEIVVSHLEHHANIVPWQQLAAEKGARLRVIPVDERGQVLLDEYRKLLGDRTKIVAVTHVSNALGTIVPVKEIIEAAHAVGARVLIDGAQSVSHLRVNVQALNPDFFVFSGHKIFGPTGIGVVWGKRELLDAMPPWQGGGNMIADVTFERTVYQPAPARFEAGTGNIADAVGLGAALDYVDRIGLENIARYEHDLLVYAMRAMQTVPGLRLIGTADEKASVLSFVLQGYRVDEVGQALSREGIAVRAGHHCAQPILRRYGLEATVRPSLAFYNTCAEIDLLVAVLLRLAHARPVPASSRRGS